GLFKRLRLGRTQRAAAVVIMVSALLTASVESSAIQEQKDKKKSEAQEPSRRDDGKVPTGKELEKARKQEDVRAAQAKLSPAEVIAEYAIIAYGGRKQIETARAAIQETGTIRLATDQGDLTGNYLLRSIRKEKSWLDLLRVDLELSSADSQSQNTPPIKYVIGFNGASVWSAQNGQYVSPRAGADIAFRAQLTHEYMALLRYKEDGSKIDYIGLETVVGVECFVVDLTTADGEKTRFWLSSRTYRVLHCEYELKLVEGQP